MDNPGQKYFSEIQEELLNNQPEIMAPPQLVPSPPPPTAKELATAVAQNVIDDTVKAEQATRKTGYSATLQVVNWAKKCEERLRKKACVSSAYHLGNLRH